MTNAKLAVGCATLMIVTCLSGLIHGHLRDRWGKDDEIASRGDALSEMPKSEFGNWRLLSESELDASSIEMLECTGYITRSYLNTETRDVVRMFVVHGPQGPISVHTPEVCYSSRHYELPESKDRMPINVGGEQHHLWTLRMISRGEIDKHLLQVCYGWTTSTDPWQAPSSARLEFLGEPSLYKIQIACQVPLDHSFKKRNPGMDFLEAFIPELKRHLASASE